MNKATEANIQRATDIARALIAYGDAKKANNGPIKKQGDGSLSFLPELVAVVETCGATMPPPPPTRKATVKGEKVDRPASKKDWETIATKAIRSTRKKAQWAWETLDGTATPFMYADRHHADTYRIGLAGSVVLR